LCAKLSVNIKKGERRYDFSVERNT